MYDVRIMMAAAANNTNISAQPYYMNTIKKKKIYVYYNKSRYNSASTHMFANFKSFKVILLPSMRNASIYMHHIVSPHLNEMPSAAYTLIHRKR